MAKTRAVFVLVFLLMAAFVYYQRQTILRLKTEIAALREEQDELNQMVHEAQRLIISETKSELKKQQAEHSELLRLRGEVGRLKRQSASSPAPSVSPVQPQEAATPSLSTNDFVQFTTNLTVELQNGETMITGGWDTGDGKKVFVFVT